MNEGQEEEVKHLIEEALQTDGAHHKQWYLEKIASVLGFTLKDVWYDDGIAP